MRLAPILWLLAIGSNALGCGAPDRTMRMPPDSGISGSSGAGVGGAAGAGVGDSSTGGAGNAGAAGAVVGCGSCDPTLEQCHEGQFCVAKLVQITGGYAIDSTEVTRSQYASWLATGTNTSDQPPHCTWNTSFVPDSNTPGPPGTSARNCDTTVWPPGEKGKYPVVCVDWCDATAYCAGVGKRLCGKIQGGPNAPADLANPGLSQWFNACSSGGKSAYPYGDTYQSPTCNGNDKGIGAALESGSMSGCASSVNGYKGVYDLSGNVFEWEDSCAGSDGGEESCLVRGGSFVYCNEQFTYMRCDINVPLVRREFSSGIGFRCCSE